MHIYFRITSITCVEFTQKKEKKPKNHYQKKSILSKKQMKIAYFGVFLQSPFKLKTHFDKRFSGNEQVYKILKRVSRNKIVNNYKTKILFLISSLRIIYPYYVSILYALKASYTTRISLINDRILQMAKILEHQLT